MEDGNMIIEKLKSKINSKMSIIKEMEENLTPEKAFKLVYLEDYYYKHKEQQYRYMSYGEYQELADIHLRTICERLNSMSRFFLFDVESYGAANVPKQIHLHNKLDNYKGLNLSSTARIDVNTESNNKTKVVIPTFKYMTKCQCADKAMDLKEEISNIESKIKRIERQLNKPYSKILHNRHTWLLSQLNAYKTHLKKTETNFDSLIEDIKVYPNTEKEAISVKDEVQCDLSKVVELLNELIKTDYELILE